MGYQRAAQGLFSLFLSLHGAAFLQTLGLGVITDLARKEKRSGLKEQVLSFPKQKALEVNASKPKKGDVCAKFKCPLLQTAEF